jgi:cytochrome c oxidase subunit 4
VGGPGGRFSRKEPPWPPEAKKMNKEKQNIHPFSTYLSIWFGLLVLTGVTVTVAGLNLGNLSVLGAILIAAVKSTLVVLFFMHIKYEDRVFKIMLGVAIITLVVIMVLTFIDVSFR